MSESVEDYLNNKTEPQNHKQMSIMVRMKNTTEHRNRNPTFWSMVDKSKKGGIQTNSRRTLYPGTSSIT
jgi:hypothetical protein